MSMVEPVLFLVFNRPDTTRRVFEAIRAAAPTRLYVAADGPRSDRAGEAERCADVRRIATDVDWPCEVHTLFRDENLGCKRGVSSGIDWFFAHEPEGIILEDDIVPLPSFFPFCSELLERYRDDQRISMISGCTMVGRHFDPGSSYFGSRYMHIWGWASWRRAWAHYDVAMRGWPDTDSAAKLAQVLGGRRAAIAHWTEIFDSTARGEIDTWDYQWVYSGWMNNMYALLPAQTLIENIGFGIDATHTTGEAPALISAARPAEMHFPLCHPAKIEGENVDALIERIALRLSPQARIKARISRLGVVRHLRARVSSANRAQ